jgi:hypothetical protein
LKTVWKNTATVVTHSSASPYWTNAAGADQPLAAADRAAEQDHPGADHPEDPEPWVGGGAGSSARFHGSSPERSSCAIPSAIGPRLIAFCADRAMHALSALGMGYAPRRARRGSGGCRGRARRSPARRGSRRS